MPISDWFKAREQRRYTTPTSPVSPSDLPDGVRRAVARAWRESISYGLAHRTEALDYALTFARGLERAQADRFVGMYVNDFTVDYGEQGRRAVEELLARGHREGLMPGPVALQFIGA